LKSKVRNFLSGGVNLAVVISMEFLVKDPLGVLDLGYIFANTGSDQSVLKPTIRPFNFASGLRGKRMNDLDIAVPQDLFPLRGCLIGQKVVLIPEGVPSPNKSEDRMGIDIVGVRKAISKANGLEGQDMGPTGLFPDQNGVEEEPTVIIQGSDEIPFFFRGRSPEMMGGVMLDQFSGITGQDFSVMECPLRFLEIEPMLFGTIDNRVQGDFLTIGLPQTVPDIAIVIRCQRNFFVPNDFFFNG
jgi:hypothetical protein